MLTPAEKQAIHAYLSTVLEPGDYPVPVVSNHLIAGHVSHRDFGYGKCKRFLADFPELFQVYAHSETGADWVKVKSWRPAAPAKAPSAPAKAAPAAPPPAPAPARAPSPGQDPRIPTQPLTHFCYVSNGIRHFMFKYLSAESKDAVPQILEEDYAAALAQNKVCITPDQRIAFPCRYRKADGSCVYIFLQKNQQEGPDWVVSRVEAGEIGGEAQTPAPEPAPASVQAPAPRPTPEPQRIPEQRPQPVPERRPQPAPQTRPEQSSQAAPEQTRPAPAAAAHPAPAPEEKDIPFSIPQEPLDQFCLLPDTPVKLLSQHTGETPDAIRKALTEDYQKAAADGKVQHSTGKGEHRLSFPCRYQKNNRAAVIITIQTGAKHPTFSWYLKHIDYSVQPGKLIEQFAFLGWPSFLSRLAEKALPESWDFEKSTRKEYDILKKYITYTFYRLTLEDKICISSDNEFAAFNTGLVDEHYNDICACFERNKAEDTTNVRWIFKEFATAGYREYGKRLTKYFNPLPQPAQYFQRKEDLLFDLDKSLLCDFDHIIIDNIHRLPLNFLCSQLYDCADAREPLRVLQEEPARREAAYQQLRELLDDGSKWCNRLTNRLKEAIDLAKKQIRWNFKIAIPSYFPTGNSMSLMIPLCLENELQADTVLVVELTPSGNYQGQTILTLQQAYIDARLLCRPNSEWLTTANLANIESDTDEE